MDDRKQGGEELHKKPENPKGPLAAREEEVLEFWDREKIFERSVEKPSPKGEFTFYDGPPFANGLPHYGHILASAIKDAIPRYRTMQGFRVRRQWGWDCHGLPVENLVEKELGFKSKRDIEEYGIEKFNQAARVSIMKDVSDWKRIIPRVGRWADMGHDYKTMDASYTESVWWAFKTLYGKGLAYEGFKAMHFCPRCGTTLSNNEVAQGYMDIEDFAVTVKLRLEGEPDTSLLIWTTTPWTLPGNTAAAVKADAEYVKVWTDDRYVIVSSAYAAKKFPQGGETMLGKELVGKKYAPPFDYFKNELHKHKTHAWKVYAADYVTVEDGTGIVHLAPAYGADDLALAQKHKIPLIQHVTEDGRFVSTVKDFAHLPVKPKGRHQETDAKIVDALRAKGLLVEEEKIKHSYPHCWRCDTPLLNWAATSWFVNVEKLKPQLLKQNAAIGWVPEHVGKGRFHNGLESAPDWAISRSRYWGAPLPVWRNQKTKEIKVVGSIEELLTMGNKSGNRYFVMRHGEARSNLDEVLETHGDPNNHLTERGRSDAKAAAGTLKEGSIDLIITSPFLRTKETAAIVQKRLGLPESAVLTDERLREIDLGVFSGKSIKEWGAFYRSVQDRFANPPEGGETFADVRRRMGGFLFEIERRYVGKNILIVSHGNPLWILQQISARRDSASLTEEILPERAKILELPFAPFPHNQDFEIDLHRPYIDDFNTGQWRRDPHVFDCWFESGSMPYASNGYPRSKENFDPKGFFGFGAKGYPADFIAEGLDQTRGWFYSLIVLGTALFGKTPYKNVIVNGIVVAQDGQKMSKRLKNYPDPMEVVEKYGADSLRYFLLSSPVVRGEDLRFSERGVEEVQKKLLMRLDNVRSFYDLYATGKPARADSSHALDRWILARLAQLIESATAGFERYELDVAARPLGPFIDDLSTWYVRRSRDRFKEEGSDREDALATLRYVLTAVSKVMAPLMPFFAEDLYRRLREESDPVSVHLCEWPAAGGADPALIADMAMVRELAAKGLQLREKAGIKVRQPLRRFSAPEVPQGADMQKILMEELNVKAVVADPLLGEAAIDTELTAELKEEGMFREYVRTIQDWRKAQKLSVSDRPGLLIKTPVDMEFIRAHREALRDATGLLSLEVKEAQELALEKL